MKSYTSLSAVATTFTVIGYFNLITGIVFALFLGQSTDYQSGIQKVLILILIATGTIFSSLLFWAIAQFIKLLIDIAQDVNTIGDNIYLIAKKANDNIDD